MSGPLGVALKKLQIVGVDAHIESTYAGRKAFARAEEGGHTAVAGHMRLAQCQQATAMPVARIAHCWAQRAKENRQLAHCPLAVWRCDVAQVHVGVVMQMSQVVPDQPG